MKQASFFSQITYRHYIEREFSARCRRNPSYSLRAYARDLEVPPSKLSEVIRKTCGLSAQSATLMAPKLKLTEKETEHFVTLVEAEHSRSSTRKAQAKELLQKFQALNGFTEIDLEKAKIISDWYHTAILELMTLEQFESSPLWMAEQLNLDLEVVEKALERLQKFNLICLSDGKYSVNDQNTATLGGVPSREIREHHYQVIQKASESVEGNILTERDLSTMMIAIDEKDFFKVQKKLQEFRRSLAQELQTETIRNRVYCLAIQFFPLSRKKVQS